MKKKKKVSFPGCIGHLASGQTTSRLLIHPKEENSSNLSSSSSSSSSSCSYTNTARMFVSFLVFASLLSSLSTGIVIPSNAIQANQTLRAADDLRKLRKVHHLLRKINKPSTKTIQSPDGDLIDCVETRLQPAFDHRLLKGQKPLDPPERPNCNESSTGAEESAEIFQLWAGNGDSCPEGTIPIRRITEKDVLRASSVRRFGRKPRRGVRRDSSGSGHEHAVAFVNGGQYYGAKASINVWAPYVADRYEFSLSQIWVISGSFGNDLNTIEAGWQVSPELYGDNSPRFFTYWTADAYQTTGCYNLFCSGFVQTNHRIAVGAAISPRSTYRGRQFDITVMIWKDPRHGHWWLQLGSGILVGYWPAYLFSHLRNHANMIQFGGEIVNFRSHGIHSSTQMGSGHFAWEGFGKASYFRNTQVVDWDNNLIPPPNLRSLADHPNCYDIRQGRNIAWGTYFYYGGPGRNVRCP
ncbi:hypothetical protein SAY86_025352 [Trapa natans]|uniref:Neprosin PEP catalytic domain-containing protein n=1 Tax=Trapa natans TaxID=22666 RepID=A0AAN7MIU9_TRANT|nr:hypothetical protein SAY86_025352 [Trapa natans]